MDYELEKYKIARNQMYMQMLQIALSATLLYFLVFEKVHTTAEEDEDLLEEEVEA